MHIDIKTGDNAAVREISLLGTNYAGKKIWLKKAGIRWRAFKTYLADHFIYVESPTVPLLKYKWIITSDYEKFDRIWTDPNLEISLIYDFYVS